MATRSRMIWRYVWRSGVALAVLAAVQMPGLVLDDWLRDAGYDAWSYMAGYGWGFFLGVSGVMSWAFAFPRKRHPIPLEPARDMSAHFPPVKEQES